MPRWSEPSRYQQASLAGSEGRDERERPRRALRRSSEPQHAGSDRHRWVGAESARTPVDSGSANRVVLDVNGDGYPDFLIAASEAPAG